MNQVSKTLIKAKNVRAAFQVYFNNDAGLMQFTKAALTFQLGFFLDFLDKAYGIKVIVTDLNYSILIDVGVCDHGLEKEFLYDKVEESYYIEVRIEHDFKYVIEAYEYVLEKLIKYLELSHTTLKPNKARISGLLNNKQQS